MGTVQHIYTTLGRPLSAEAVAGLRRYLAQHPQHRDGVQRYSLAQFGLEAAEEIHRDSAYRAYFGIPAEEHPGAA
jgi:hypothetical protein